MSTPTSHVVRIGLLLIATTCFGAAQGLPALRIDSPSDGTVVHPGQTITVAVSSPSGVAIAACILGEGGLEGEWASLPGRIQVHIPEKLAPKRYSMTAVGAIPGQDPVYAGIELDVELPDSPRTVATETTTAKAAIVEKITADSRLIFTSQGEEQPIRIMAHYATGEEVDITESSKLIYMSSNRAIATVNGLGMVKAVAPGQSSITAIYVDGGRSVRTSVPVTVESQILAAVPSHLNFGGNRGILVGTNASQQVTFTYQTANETLKILRIEITGSFSQTNNCVSSSAKRTEKQCAVIVTFSPRSAGTVDGELTVHDNWGEPTRIPLHGLATAR